ncbi:urokinase plasminogen activator surface receptor-like [Myripristis murdjan]|uniref:urokinase plasminogen activator surface receptor-like n=1 Tax=Myripristis murdjan TaxID=586833 RepID=UPI0011762FF3|nr:urokinase plasminogen activator surface receptor-like [Myripristis murdjan]
MEELCTTAAFKINLSGNSTQYIMKTCLPAVMCDASTDPLSLNLGFGRVVGSVKCCNKDLCNSQTLPTPADPESNGLQCYSCDSSACRNKVQCVGVENRCFNGTVNAGPITAHTFGCASSNLCEGFSELDSMIIPGFNFTDGPTCCEGNFCNSVSTTRLSVFPLLLGLISLIFIY